MKFDRSVFKPTPISAIKEDAERVNQLTRYEGSFHSIAEGTNDFRLFPAHPGEKSFLVSRVVHWLPKWTDKKDSKTDEKEWRRYPFMDARQHGGFRIDLVDEYKTQLYKVLKTPHFTETEEGKKEATRIADLIKDYKVGLKPNPTYVCYAQRKTLSGWGDIKLLEFGNSVHGQLEKLSLTSDPNATEPFTDVDKGRPVLIYYNSAEKAANDKYKVNKWDEPLPLEDEDLDAFMVMAPLSELYNDSMYTEEEFNLTYEGLQQWDKDHEINHFESEEWQQLDLSDFYTRFGSAEAVDKETGEVKEGKTLAEAAENVPPEHVEEVEEAEEMPPEVEVDHLDPLTRNELKIYIRDNKLGLKVFPSFSDDDVRDKIRAKEKKGDDLADMRNEIQK